MNFYDDTMLSINKNINAINKANEQKREERKLELETITETNKTISEFKKTVEIFISATDEQTKATKKQNTIMLVATVAASIATVFSAVGVYLQLKTQGLL